jgi:aryl-alcohol dehydrogenase-like predicted oxidoreductase
MLETTHNWPNYLDRRSFVGLGALGLAAATLPMMRRAGAAQGEPAGVEYRRLGKTEMRVSLMGFGGLSIAMANTEQDRVNRLLHTAIDDGLNSIDTAPCYPWSEEKLGRALKNHRDKVYLFSKVGHTGSYGGPWAQDEATLIGIIDRTLERLGTDHIDLVQIHSCSEAVLREGTVIGAIERAREQGKVRFLGYSGDNEAAKYSIECGKFDTLMTSLSVLDQSSLEEILPMAHAADMGVIIKRPICNAVFRYKEMPEIGYYREYWRRMGVLEYPFMRGDARMDSGPDGAAGVMLRFVAMVEGVHTMVVGTTSPGRWESNNALLQAGALSKERFDAIRERWDRLAGPDWRGQI